VKPTESQFPEQTDDRPEGWDYLTPETMDEMENHFTSTQPREHSQKKINNG